MVRRQQRPVSVQSSDPEDQLDATLVPDVGLSGVSPEEYPDPDYTTYEELGRGLTAPVKLPSREAMTVNLGPLNIVDRMEEYQADENLGHTLFGLFAGAALGILVNWATGPNAEITGASLVLLITFAVIAAAVGIWLCRIKKRKKNVKGEIEGL